MQKNVFVIDRGRLQRSFFGTHDLKNPAREAWQEAGHYYQGVELLGSQISEVDGLLRDNASIEGYESLGVEVTGSAEPAQNDDLALAFYKYVMNGTRNAAFLVATPKKTVARLWLFRLVPLGGNVWQDNRIAVKTDLNYSGKLRGKTEFTGYVDAYEVYSVNPATVAVAGGKLNFTVLNPTPTALGVETNNNGI